MQNLKASDALNGNAQNSFKREGPVAHLKKLFEVLAQKTHDDNRLGWWLLVKDTLCEPDCISDGLVHPMFYWKLQKGAI